MTCQAADAGFRLDVSWVGPVRHAAAARTSPRHRPPGARLARGAWVLRHSTRLTNPLDHPVVLAEPRRRGRAGRGLRRGVLARADLGPGPDRAGARRHRRAGGRRRGAPLGAPHRRRRGRRAALERAVRAAGRQPVLSLVRPAARLPGPRPGHGLGPPAERSPPARTSPTASSRRSSTGTSAPPTCPRCSSPCPAEPRRDRPPAGRAPRGRRTGRRLSAVGEHEPWRLKVRNTPGGSRRCHGRIKEGSSPLVEFLMHPERR